MIVTINPEPGQEIDTMDYAEDAESIARAVEKVGALRGWRVSRVDVYDALEGATVSFPTPNPRDFDDEEEFENAKH